MAATRLITVHGSKGGGKGGGIGGRMDYIEDDEKTEDGKWLSSYECDPKTAANEFELSMREYLQKMGDNASDNVIAYQIRQSFKPGEITPEEANRIGYETAMRFTKGEHAFVVATHTDKAHIHNHVLFNAVNLSCDRKFRNFWRSGMALGRLSNLICMENGYSVIAPEPYHSDKVYVKHPEGPGIRNGIRADIDKALSNQPKTFEDFLQEMKALGYEVKSAKHTSVKGKNQKRFVRFDSLGDGYTEGDIKKKIDGTSKVIESKKEPVPFYREKNFNLLINVQDIASKGKGYENWAKKFNIKQVSKALLFIQENGISSYDELEKRTEESAKRFGELRDEIKNYESRMDEISRLRQNIIDYSKTRGVYQKYKATGFDRKFFEEHRAEIMIHKRAKDSFNKIQGKIPSVKELNEEFDQLRSKKNEAYSEYKLAKKDMEQFHIAKYDIGCILGIREAPAQHRPIERAR